MMDRSNELLAKSNLERSKKERKNMFQPKNDTKRLKASPSYPDKSRP